VAARAWRRAWAAGGRPGGGAVEAHTGLQGLVAAAEQLRACSQHCLHDVRGRQGPRDALCALLSAAEASERRERSPPWVWAAMAPERQRRLASDGGRRPLALPPRVVHPGAQVLAPDGAPLGLTEGWREALPALLTPAGPWLQPARQRAQGPPPPPRWRPRPGRRSAPGVKTGRRRRLGRVPPRVVVGTLAAVPQVRTARGWQMPTACSARVPLSLRPPGAAGGRQGPPSGRGRRAGGSSSVCPRGTIIFAARLRPDASPGRRLSPPHGMGSAKRGQPHTPARAAGLTQQVWAWRDVRRFRVPPGSQAVGV
jgi:hypothetical protein